MSENAYQSMSELVKNISQKLESLEKGQLPAEEIDQLANDARELNERLVVLRYKAYEKQLIVKPVAQESKKEEERVIEGFKLSLSTPDPQQINLIDVIEEESSEQEEVSNLQPAVSSEQEIVGSLQSADGSLEVLEEKPETENKPSTFNFQPSTPNPQPSTFNSKPGLSNESNTKAETSSLNQKLSATQQPTLAEKLQKKPIADLRAAIGLNQKFLFMNDLFEGENSTYNEAIAKLNAFSNVDEAKNYLLELGTRYKWTLENENVLTFTELVERRYA